MALTQAELEKKERDLVVTNIELFVKDFCGKIEHPKNLKELFPYQELAAQLVLRYDVTFKDSIKKVLKEKDDEISELTKKVADLEKAAKKS